MTTYRVGMVLESKDHAYEPGRRIRLVAPELGDSVGARRHWGAVTVENPRRPHRVGASSLFSEQTLRAKWAEVS